MKSDSRLIDKVDIPVSIRNTILKVLGNQVTWRQHGILAIKRTLSIYLEKSDLENPLLRERILKHFKMLKIARTKLINLSDLTYLLKYPFGRTESSYLMLPSELQLMLHYLRVDMRSLYYILENLNLDIQEQRVLAINDGTLKTRIEFLRLNVLKNERRKLLRKISKREEAIKFVKLSLKKEAPPKKPLTFKRKLRKLWYSLLLNKE